MYNFTFSNPTKLIFGKNTIAQLKENISVNEKIMITFGGGSVKANGVYDQVKEALKGHSTVEFWGIEANPVYETLLKAVELAQKEQVTYLLAVGGGSVLDGTKFIAAALPYKGTGTAWDILLNPSVVTSAIPFGTVLTLPATGSEMNNGAVISKKETQEKLAFHSSHTFPQFSILDPQTTFSLPLHQVACGIADTFVHTVEQYMTLTGESFLMDRWSEGILQTLVEIAPKAIVNQKDYDTMANFMLSATMALNGFTAMGVTQDWATHMIGHELTAFHGITHGETLAIVYPSLMNVMRKEKEDKILQYGLRVWNICEGSTEERINQTIEKTESFFRSLGLKTRLNEHQVGEATIEKIVQRFEQRGWNLGEGGIVTPLKVREILKGCL